MSIEAAITTLILGNGAVTALIGGRLRPVQLPQNENLPAVVYQIISETEELTTQGAVGLIDARVQLTCFAATHAAVVELAEALKSCLQDYSGVSAGVTIQHVQVLNRGDVPALDVEAEQVSRYGKFLDVQFSYES